MLLTATERLRAEAVRTCGYAVLACTLFAACAKQGRVTPQHQSPTVVVLTFPSRSATAAGVLVSCRLKMGGTNRMSVTLTIENASPSTILIAPKEHHLPRTRVLDDGSIVVLYGAYDGHHGTIHPPADIVLAPGEVLEARSAVHVARSPNGVRARGAAFDLQQPHPWMCGLHYRLQGGTTAMLATSEELTLSIDTGPLEGDDVL